MLCCRFQSSWSLMPCTPPFNRIQSSAAQHLLQSLRTLLQTAYVLSYFIICHLLARISWIFPTIVHTCSCVDKGGYEHFKLKITIQKLKRFLNHGSYLRLYYISCKVCFHYRPTHCVNFCHSNDWECVYFHRNKYGPDAKGNNRRASLNTKCIKVRCHRCQGSGYLPPQSSRGSSGVWT